MTVKSKFKWRLYRLVTLVKAEASTFFITTFGCILYTIGVVGFTIPYKFPDSGVTGIAVLVNYAVGLSPVWIISISNALLIIWGWRELSPRFVLWSAYGVALFSILLKVMPAIPFPVMDEALLAAIFGGVIKGLGGGLVFRMGASLGGTDVIVAVLRKRYGIEVGKYSFYINLAILGVSIFVVGFESAMFGLVGVYASSVTIDNTLSSFDRRCLVLLIPQNLDNAEHYIAEHIGRGVTILDGTGGYSKTPKPTLLCLMSKRQVVDLKHHLAKTDPRAFMVVTDASEVLGRGFKGWKEN